MHTIRYLTKTTFTSTAKLLVNGCLCLFDPIYWSLTTCATLPVKFCLIHSKFFTETRRVCTQDIGLS